MEKLARGGVVRAHSPALPALPELQVLPTGSNTTRGAGSAKGNRAGFWILEFGILNSEFALQLS